MNKKIWPLFLLPLSVIAAPKTLPPQEVSLKDASGQVKGQAKITEEKSGVNVHVEIEGLSPGDHAIHFHQKGVCTGPKFESAGAHFSPEKKEHGLENPQGHHAGDMRNFTADANGKAVFDLKAEHVTLSKGSHSLLRTGGTSLVVHQNPDDFRTQPAGNSGDRILCGEIRRL